MYIIGKRLEKETVKKNDGIYWANNLWCCNNSVFDELLLYQIKIAV